MEKKTTEQMREELIKGILALTDEQCKELLYLLEHPELVTLPETTR